MLTHELPSKHLPSPQSQTLISWLSFGPQPHAPIKQRLGKSSADPQQSEVVTVPPEFMHACSFAVAVPTQPETTTRTIIKTGIANTASLSFISFTIIPSRI